MASLLALSDPRLLTAEEFLQIDFGPDLKAELDNGVIRMMAGGTRQHARIQANVLGWLYGALRGSGCRPYGSDMGVRSHGMSVRYPDVSVECGSPDDLPADTTLSRPRVIVEVLSPSTRNHDLRVKKEEYRAIESVDTIVFVDPEKGTLATSQRSQSGWTDSPFSDATDVALPSLDLVMPYDQVFATN